MITITGRAMNIPHADRIVGYTGDNLVEVRIFEMSRYYDGIDLDLFDFKLDTEIKGAKNIIDLVKDVDGDKIVLAWVIGQSHILTPGRMSIQIRAFAGEDVKWHSAQDYVFVQSSINGPDAFASPLPSEFEQMEVRVTAKAREASDSAAAALASEQAAKGYADDIFATLIYEGQEWFRDSIIETLIEEGQEWEVV